MFIFMRGYCISVSQNYVQIMQLIHEFSWLYMPFFFKRFINVWGSCIRHLLMMVGTRRQSSLRRPIWIIALLSVLCLFLIAAYVYPPTSIPGTCYFISSLGQGCSFYGLYPNSNELKRELTDAEIESRVVIKDLLKFHPLQPKIPKVAFLFLTPGSLPFEKLWHKFFQVWHFLIHDLSFSDFFFFLI